MLTEPGTQALQTPAVLAWPGRQRQLVGALVTCTALKLMPAEGRTGQFQTSLRHMVSLIPSTDPALYPFGPPKCQHRRVSGLMLPVSQELWEIVGWPENPIEDPGVMYQYTPLARRGEFSGVFVCTVAARSTAAMVRQLWAAVFLAPTSTNGPAQEMGVLAAA